MVQECWAVLVLTLCLGFIAGAMVYGILRWWGDLHAKRETFRMVFCLLCVVIFVLILQFIVYSTLTTSTQIKVANYDQYRTEALKINREESAGFVQIGIAVLGAVWATMIVSKETRLTVGDRPEIAMFVLTTLLLMLFLYFNFNYERLLARLYWDMGPLLSTKSQFVDVLNSKYVATRNTITQLCFYGGLLLSALSVFSCCILRKKT
jgi:hypothetical protein